MHPIEITSQPSPAPRRVRSLSEADAVDIWLARWLQVRRKDVIARYDCDPRRIYEIWEGRRFQRARDKAQAIFAERYPTLVNQVDFSFHRRIARNADPENQLDLF